MLTLKAASAAKGLGVSGHDWKLQPSYVDAVSFKVDEPTQFYSTS
jgi:hypothetical protein